MSVIAMIVFYDLYSVPDFQQLSKLISDGRAVISTDAQIIRNCPPGQALFRSNTIRLSDPDVSGKLTHGDACVVVVAKDGRFIGDVTVALWTLRSIGPGSNAVLPESVVVYAVNRGGEVTRMDACDINYIGIVRSSKDKLH
jgi:hypothetical protein